MDPASQMLEVIDENDNVIGLETRANVHKRGLLHREIHVWFITPQKEIVFQRRGQSKDTYPGKLDATVGGHVEPDMSYEDTVVKECKEETGLTIDPKRLIFLAKLRKQSFDHITKMTNNTLRAQYAYAFSEPVESLQIEKVDGGGFELWKIQDLSNLAEENKRKFIGLVLGDDMLALFKQAAHLVLEKQE